MSRRLRAANLIFTPFANSAPDQRQKVSRAEPKRGARQVAIESGEFLLAADLFPLDWNPFQAKVISQIFTVTLPSVTFSRLCLSPTMAGPVIRYGFIPTEDREIKVWVTEQNHLLEG